MTVTNLTPPTISGTARQGQTLTTTNGTWDYDLDNISYAYQWMRCDVAGANCTDITGALNQTYVLTAADVGSTIRSEVTATESADPPPPTGDPYFDWSGLHGNYVPLSTIFAAYGTESRIKNWGGLEASLYDQANPGYLGGSKMSTDASLRVHLQATPTNPNGTGWTSRQEIKTTDPPWNPGGGSTYDKSTIRNTESTAIPGGSFAIGATVWFAADYFLPHNYGASNDTFNWATSGWHTIFDLHGNGSQYEQNWNVLESQIGPLGTNNVYHRYHLGAHEGSSDPAPPDQEWVNLLQLTDGSGTRIGASFNAWHELVVGVKFASDGVIGSSTGWVDIWHDGVNTLPQHFRPTCFPNETGIWMQFQNYKRHSAALVGGATSSVIYCGGLRSGQTRGDVQRM